MAMREAGLWIERQPVFPSGGLDTLVLFTRGRTTDWATTAMGLLRNVCPSGPDLDDPEESIRPPYWNRSDAAKNGKLAIFCGCPIRLVRFSTNRYQSCIGVYDVDSKWGPRLLLTVRLNSIFDAGRSSIMIHRVAWRFRGLSEVWNAVSMIFETEPDEVEVYQVDIFAVADRAFEDIFPTLVVNANAAFELFSRGADLLYNTHPVGIDRRKRPWYPKDVPSLVAHYAEPAGAAFGRRNGQSFLRVYVPINGMVEKTDRESSLYAENLSQKVIRSGKAQPETKFEKVHRSKRVAELIGIATDDGRKKHRSYFPELCALPMASNLFPGLKQLAFADRGPRYRPVFESLVRRANEVGMHRTLFEWRKGPGRSRLPNGPARCPSRYLREADGAVDLDEIARDALRVFFGSSRYCQDETVLQKES